MKTMKSIIKSFSFIMALVSFMSLNLIADSSKVSNSIFTVEEMHLQEVIIQVRVDSLRNFAKFYSIRKSDNGIDYSILTEMGVPASDVVTLVVADHVPDQELTYYQLIAHTRDGEEVVATAIFDPDAPAFNQNPNISDNEEDTEKGQTSMIDPHAI